jgi:hypothetical protein
MRGTLTVKFGSVLLWFMGTTLVGPISDVAVDALDFASLAFVQVHHHTSHSEAALADRLPALGRVQVAHTVGLHLVHDSAGRDQGIPDALTVTLDGDSSA